MSPATKLADRFFNSSPDMGLVGMSGLEDSAGLQNRTERNNLPDGRHVWHRRVACVLTERFGTPCSAFSVKHAKRFRLRARMRDGHSLVTPFVPKQLTRFLQGFSDSSSVSLNSARMSSFRPFALTVRSLTPSPKACCRLLYFVKGCVVRPCALTFPAPATRSATGPASF